MRTLVTNTTLLTARGRRRGDILITDGRIVAIEERIEVRDCPVIDARGCLVLPGGIDVHTHLNLQVGDQRVRDGFLTGTRAAAFGGTTCVIEHPGFGPEGCSLLHQVESYRALAHGRSLVDYGLHAVIQHVDTGVLAAIARLPGQGITSLKVYLTYSGRLNDEEIIAVLQAARRAGVLVCFHAENHAIISARTRMLRAAGRQALPASHPASRPACAEAEAIYRLICLARAAGDVPIYIVHLSTAEGLAHIRRARRQGSEILAETCPQYLLLTDTCYLEPGDAAYQYIMAPPLRRKQDCEALWEGLADGSIDVVATDHCSFSLAQKLHHGRRDVFRAPGGIPGVETRLPLLYSEGVATGRIDEACFVRLTAANPARIMGLAPHKGDLTRGADADLVLFDPDRRVRLAPDVLHQQVDFTPFAGMEVCGWPSRVLLRGETIIRGDRCCADGGSGRFAMRHVNHQEGA